MENQINTSKTTRDKFIIFDRENPNVYKLYKKFAFQIIKKGYNRIGSKMIIERIRWETAINTNDEHFKINNNNSPYYARKFCVEFPEHTTKFHFKFLKS